MGLKFRKNEVKLKYNNILFCNKNGGLSFEPKLFLFKRLQVHQINLNEVLKKRNKSGWKNNDLSFRF